jgi:hypothetical protein
MENTIANIHILFFADWLVYSVITLVFKFQVVWTTSFQAYNHKHELPVPLKHKNYIICLFNLEYGGIQNGQFYTWIYLLWYLNLF